MTIRSRSPKLWLSSTAKPLTVMAFLGLLFNFLPAEAEGDFSSALQRSIYFEQSLIGARNIEKDTLDPLYQPEQHHVFEIPAYWVDREKLTVFFDEDLMPDAIKKVYFRNFHGRRQILVTVHPDEREYFKELLLGSIPAEVHLKSTASASPRSLFTAVDSTDPELDQFSYINKVSINKNLGGNIRLIHKVELARSFFITQLLAKEKKLPSSFIFYPEFLVMIPKNWEKGGTILRAIPPEVQSGQVEHIPFFALFAKKPDGTKPILLEMVEKSGLSFHEFYHSTLVRPFLRQWLELALKHGITMEPHGQNLLLEVDSKTGRPTGRFVHRDFGGFSVDLEYRKKLGLNSPDPVEVNGYRSHFDESDVGYGLKTSLDLYFAHIVSSLAIQYEDWYKKGWVSLPGNENSFQQDLIIETEAAFKAYVGQPLHLQGWLGNMMQGIFKARSPGLCSQLFKNF